MGAVAALGYTVLTPSKYEATTQLFVTTTARTADGQVAPDAAASAADRVRSYARLASSEAVLNEVIDDLKLPVTTADLAAQIRASAEPGTVLIDVRARDASPSQARDIANAVGAHLPAVVQRLESSAADGATEDQFGTLDAAIAIRVSSEAVAPTDPASPRLVLDLLIGLLGGAAVGLVAATGQNLADRRIRTRADIVDATGIPVLAEIPTAPGHPLAAFSGSEPAGAAYAETYRRLRSHLGHPPSGRSRGSIVVASTSTGEGRTTVACNLALALAHSGIDVVLIDADLHSGAVATALAMPGSLGLTSLLTGAAQLPSVLRQWRPDSTLRVITAGPPVPNPGDLVGSPSMTSLVQAFVDNGVTVVLDTPALDTVADAAALARTGDSTLLVVRAGRTRTDRLQGAVAELRALGTSLLGIAMTDAARPRARRAAQPSPDREGVPVAPVEVSFGTPPTGPSEPTTVPDPTTVPEPTAGTTSAAAPVDVADIPHDSLAAVVDSPVDTPAPPPQAPPLPQTPQVPPLPQAPPLPASELPPPIPPQMPAPMLEPEPPLPVFDTEAPDGEQVSWFSFPPRDQAPTAAPVGAELPREDDRSEARLGADDLAIEVPQAGQFDAEQFTAGQFAEFDSGQAGFAELTVRYPEAEYSNPPSGEGAGFDQGTEFDQGREFEQQAGFERQQQTGFGDLEYSHDGYSDSDYADDGDGTGGGYADDWPPEPAPRDPLTDTNPTGFAPVRAASGNPMFDRGQSFPDHPAVPQQAPAAEAAPHLDRAPDTAPTAAPMLPKPPKPPSHGQSYSYRYEPEVMPEAPPSSRDQGASAGQASWESQWQEAPYPGPEFPPPVPQQPSFPVERRPGTYIPDPSGYGQQFTEGQMDAWPEPTSEAPPQPPAQEPEPQPQWPQAPDYPSPPPEPAEPPGIAPGMSLNSVRATQITPGKRRR